MQQLLLRAENLTTNTNSCVDPTDGVRDGMIENERPALALWKQLKCGRNLADAQLTLDTLIWGQEGTRVDASPPTRPFWAACFAAVLAAS